MSRLQALLRSRQLKLVKPKLCKNLANEFRIQLVVRAGQWQFRDMSLAMDRQMAMALAAMVARRIEMTPALGKPLSKRVISIGLSFCGSDRHSADEARQGPFDPMSALTTAWV